MGAEVLEHTQSGRMTESQVEDFVYAAAEDGEEMLREQMIESLMEDYREDPDYRGYDEDALWEHASDAVWDSGYMMYPGCWAHYHGGQYEIVSGPSSEQEELLWKLQGKSYDDEWDKSCKWDDKVFYWYDPKTDTTTIKAIVPS